MTTVGIMSMQRIRNYGSTLQAHSLRRLIDDPVLVARLGRGAVAHAQDFSWERTAERTLAAYERARGRMRAEMAS